MFRGPRPNLAQPYCAFLGAAETYGRYVERPFPSLLAKDLGMVCANFGVANAGPGYFLADEEVLGAAGSAEVAVLSVMGAQNLSNRFYSVHKWRNDRFVKPALALTRLFRDVEFIDIHYTGHLLRTLQAANPELFAIIVEEIKIAWLYRMKSVLEQMPEKTILLWMADLVPADPADPVDLCGPEPTFIDQTMLDAVAPLVSRVVMVPASPAALRQRTSGMAIDLGDEDAATLLPGPMHHAEVAEALGPVIRTLLE